MTDPNRVRLFRLRRAWDEAEAAEEAARSAYLNEFRAQFAVAFGIFEGKVPFDFTRTSWAENYHADYETWLTSPEGQCRCVGFDHIQDCPMWEVTL